jgi:hypothetical protein
MNELGEEERPGREQEQQRRTVLTVLSRFWAALYAEKTKRKAAESMCASAAGLRLPAAGAARSGAAAASSSRSASIATGYRTPLPASLSLSLSRSLWLLSEHFELIFRVHVIWSEHFVTTRSSLPTNSQTAQVKRLLSSKKVKRS